MATQGRVITCKGTLYLSIDTHVNVIVCVIICENYEMGVVLIVICNWVQ